MVTGRYHECVVSTCAMTVSAKSRGFELPCVPQAHNVGQKKTYTEYTIIPDRAAPRQSHSNSIVKNIDTCQGSMRQYIHISGGFNDDFRRPGITVKRLPAFLRLILQQMHISEPRPWNARTHIATLAVLRNHGDHIMATISVRQAETA